MRSMALLIDSNVILNSLCKREPYYEAASQVIELCKTSFYSGYIAFHTLPTIWYVLRKQQIPNRRELLLNLTDFLIVANATHQEVVDAIRNEAFVDFEDCLQEKCALSVQADYIITENAKDFIASAIPAVSATDFLKMLCQAQAGGEL